MISSTPSAGSPAAHLLQFLARANGATGAASAPSGGKDAAQDLFTTPDSDGDGSISRTEFSDFASRFAPQTGNSLLSAQETGADDMFGSLDGDGDGTLSEDELAALKPPPADGGMIQNLFDSLDANGDGAIDQDELASALKGSDADSAALFGQWDANKDGSLDLDELAAALQPPAGQETASAAGQAGATGSGRSYDPLDANKDGVVSEEERAAGKAQAQQTTPTTGVLSAGTLGSLLQSVQMAA